MDFEVSVSAYLKKAERAREKILNGKMIPLAKQSKASKRKYHLARRGSWNGLSPVTRVAKSRKVYDRNKQKQALRERGDE